MTDNPFMLDPTGKCTSCEKVPPSIETVACTSCKQHFHGICTKANDNNFICRISFMKIWHSPSRKCNFEWHCDSCMTVKEEREILTLENKLDINCLT